MSSPSCKITGVWQSIKAQWLFLKAKQKCSCARSIKIKTALKLIWGFDVILWGHDAFDWDQRSVPGHMWPSEDMMNMHEVRGWDFSLEVKRQLEVTHAQELTSDLMQTNRDLTGWRHSQINFEYVWKTNLSK